MIRQEEEEKEQKKEAKRQKILLDKENKKADLAERDKSVIKKVIEIGDINDKKEVVKSLDIGKGDYEGW